MKILYLAHRIPYPPNKGDKIRSFNEIKHLSARHEIHLACLADDPNDLKYKEDLGEYCKTVTVFSMDPRLARMKSLPYLLSPKPLSVPYFYSMGLQKAIDQLLSTHDFDCIFCFSSPMAEYVFSSAASREQPAASGLPRTIRFIMDFVDVDSDKWAQYAKSTHFPKSWVYGMESKRLGRYERRVAEAFDHSIFVTEAEVKMFQGKNPHVQNVTAITNGVDLDYFSPHDRGRLSGGGHPSLKFQCPGPSEPLREASIEKPVILFTGAMDYYANIDGVLWFVSDIFPLIKKEIAGARFIIVGSNPTEKILALRHHDGIVVTGYVKDIRSYYEMADVGVIPLRLARGIQNKVLEAMAMGLPVVVTSQAFEGIQAERHRELLVEDDPVAFSRAVLKILQTPSFRMALRDHGRKCIEDHYSWTTNLSKLDAVIQ